MKAQFVNDLPGTLIQIRRALKDHVGEDIREVGREMVG